MTPQAIRKLVEQDIGNRWNEGGWRGLPLREALVTPYKTMVINRHVRNQNVVDAVEEVWVVLEEKAGADNGYKIFYDEAAQQFGLLTAGFKDDPFPVVVGVYGRFRDALKAL